MPIQTASNDNKESYTFWPDQEAEQSFNDTLNALRDQLSDADSLAYSPELARITVSHVKSLARFYGANTKQR